LIETVKNAITKKSRIKFFISRIDWLNLRIQSFHTGILIVQWFYMKTHETRLTFPQRNWLLLCILTAIIVAIAYYLIETNMRATAPSNEIQTTSGTANGGDTSHTEGIPPDSLKH